MTTKYRIKLTSRQVGIVLAALSNAQHAIKEIDFSQWLDDDKEVTAKEIDFICEEINFG